MPRFTLRQLLTSLFVGCVFIAVLRDVFAGGPHVAVSMIVAWATLAVFYFRWRLWLTLVVHCLFPSIVILSYQLLMLLEVRTGIWQFYPLGHVLSDTCRGSSLVSFPIAFIVLIRRSGVLFR